MSQQAGGTLRWERPDRRSTTTEEQACPGDLERRRWRPRRGHPEVTKWPFRGQHLATMRPPRTERERGWSARIRALARSPAHFEDRNNNYIQQCDFSHFTSDIDTHPRHALEFRTAVSSYSPPLPTSLQILSPLILHTLQIIHPSHTDRCHPPLSHMAGCYQP